MSEELYDLPEDVTTQTLIQNRYSFWCHKRGKQTAVSFAKQCTAISQTHQLSYHCLICCLFLTVQL
jgi:hypothetical protein